MLALYRALMNTTRRAAFACLLAFVLLWTGCAAKTQQTPSAARASSISSESGSKVWTLFRLADVLKDFELRTDGPDSAGGVGAIGSFGNDDNRTFKYVRIHVTPFNAVGDQVVSEIGSKSETWLKVTGPMKPAEFSPVAWDPIWYNPSITEIRVDAVEIEYMDGSVERYEGKPQVFE